jgi:hypothetical protein
LGARHSSYYNQLLRIAMGAQRKKEITQNIEGRVLQDEGGWSKGS